MTCSTCKHWSPKTSGAMAKHLFCRCAIGPAWRFHAPSHACARHAQATPDVVASRVAWIEKQKPRSPA